MKDNHPDEDAADLVAQRNAFMATLGPVLKDLWPDGAEFELTVAGEDGEPLVVMGGSLPPQGFGL